MEKKIILIAAIIATVCCLGLVFTIGILPNRTISIDNPLERYQKATRTQPVSYSLSIEKETTIQSGENFFWESSNAVFECQSHDSYRARLAETIKSGATTTNVTETYVDDTLYLTVQEQSFSGNIPENKIKERYIPATILDASLYRKCTGTEKRGVSKITFSSPIGAERWAIPGDAELLDATGNAYIGTNGKLTQVVYSIRYRHGNMEIAKDYTIDISSGITKEILPPEKPDSYQPVDYIDGPVLLEKMCGLLLQRKSITTQIEESMYCGAFGDLRKKSDSLEIRSFDPMDVAIDTSITQSNTSHADTPTTTRQYQAFTGGAYSITANNGPAETNESITAAYMKEYCQNMLLGTLLLPQYIQNARLTVDADRYSITYEADDAFAEIVAESICNTLYADPTALSSRATSHTVEAISNTIELDKATGLPIRATITYRGTYVIDKVSYPLEYSITQTYTN